MAKHTETQPAPNLSTEHQKSGDARRPGDLLDKGQEDRSPPDEKTSLTRNK